MKHFPGKDYNNILWTYHRPVRQCRIFKKLLHLGTLCSWKGIIMRKAIHKYILSLPNKTNNKTIPLQPLFFLGKVDYPVGESAGKSSSDKTINWDQQYVASVKQKVTTACPRTSSCCSCYLLFFFFLPQSIQYNTIQYNILYLTKVT